MMITGKSDDNGVVRVDPKSRRGCRRWTEAEDRQVVLGWGHVPLREVAAAIRRTELSVYLRGTRVLGLDTSVPQGFESLSGAARRLGVSERQLREMNAIVGNSRYIRRAVTMPMPGKAPRRFIIEADKADEVMRLWSATETPAMAARRYGFAESTVRAALRLSAARGAVEGIPREPKGTKHWRVPSTVIDAVLTRWVRAETAAAAAARHGVSPHKVARALRKHGLTTGTHAMRDYLRSVAGGVREQYPGAEREIVGEAFDMFFDALAHLRGVAAWRAWPMLPEEIDEVLVRERVIDARARDGG